MKSNIAAKLLFLTAAAALNAQVVMPSKVYQLAVENSSKIKSSKLQLEAKKEDINQVISRLYPQISGSVDYSDTDYNINELQNVRNRDINEVSLDYTLSLKQSIYDHEIYTKLDLERKRVELFDIKVQLQSLELSNEVLNTYFEALKSKNKIDLLNAYLRFNEQKLEAVQKRFDMNLSDKMELLKTKVDLNRSKIDLAKEKKLFEVYLLNLKQQTSLENIDIPEIDFENFDLSFFEDKQSMEKNKEDYLYNNLQLLQAKKGIELSELTIDNARSVHYPKLSFDARYTAYNSDDITTDYENYKRLMVSLQIPLYQGGAAQSRVRSSKLAKKASVEDLEVARKEIELKYNEIVAKIDASIKSTNVYKEALESSKSYLEFVTLGYENGLKSIIDLLEAENKLHEIKYEYIQNIQEFVQSYVEFLIITNNLGKLDKVDNLVIKR